MTRPLKAGLIAASFAVVASGAIEAALATTENDFFQFCTTKAYGWPAPWRIDSCECEGGMTTFPAGSKIANFSTIAGIGIVGFALIGGIALRRERSEARQTEQARTGQPATRPVVEPKADDNPQPEADGRSRKRVAPPRH